MRSRINCETECLVEPPMTSHGHWSRRARPLGSRPRAVSKWHPDCKSGGDIDSWLQTLLLAWDMPRRLLAPLPKREKVSAISLVSYIWHLSHCVVSDHAPVPLQWNLGRGICDLGNHDIAWEILKPGNVSSDSWEPEKSPLHTSTLVFFKIIIIYTCLIFHSPIILTMLNIYSHSWEPKYCLNTRTDPGGLKSWEENRRDVFGNLKKDYNTFLQRKDAAFFFKERVM